MSSESTPAVKPGSEPEADDRPGDENVAEPRDSDYESFIADYYEHLAAEDRASYSPAALRDRAQTHLQVAFTRQPKTATVVIRTDAGRSMLYIVTDDMPFLVDSVTAELVRVSAMWVVDGALLLLCAASGVEVGAEVNWAHAGRRNLPRAVFVNKM
ncbi:MAG: hypothetical protein R6W83_04540, partial [Cryobacterium sp.]